MADPELFIEALIFSSEQGLRLEEIAYCLQTALEYELSPAAINQAISNIQQKYGAENLAIELVKVNNGYQFLTKKTFYPVIRPHWKPWP
jgi:segregation and condensation protein B